MKILIYITAVPVFFIALIAYIYIEFRLRPKHDSDFDDYYHELEDQHPGYAKYQKWSQITFAVAVIAALALFLTATT